VPDDYLDPNPLLDDALIMRLTYDMAAGIHEGDTLATRYGFTDTAALRRYLKKHPQIIVNAQKGRALVESDENTESRVRLRAMQATEDLIPTTAAIAADPRIGPQQRIEAFKQLSRVSGLDASAAAKAANPGGPAFSLNIIFRNAPTETITVVPDEPAPMARLTPGVTDADEVSWEEEV
jgi:hypothetical protein